MGPWWHKMAEKNFLRNHLEEHSAESAVISPETESKSDSIYNNNNNMILQKKILVKRAGRNNH